LFYLSFISFILILWSYASISNSMATASTFLSLTFTLMVSELRSSESDNGNSSSLKSSSAGDLDVFVTPLYAAIPLGNEFWLWLLSRAICIIVGLDDNTGLGITGGESSEGVSVDLAGSLLDNVLLSSQSSLCLIISDIESKELFDETSVIGFLVAEFSICTITNSCIECMWPCVFVCDVGVHNFSILWLREFLSSFFILFLGFFDVRIDLIGLLYLSEFIPFLVFFFISLNTSLLFFIFELVVIVYSFWVNEWTVSLLQCWVLFFVHLWCWILLKCLSICWVSDWDI